LQFRVRGKEDLDAVAEAQDLQRILAEMEDVTDLARERMEAAVTQADRAAGTLARGDTDEAAKEVGTAAGQFGELARQVAALLAEEAPDRIAMARDMTAGLAEGHRMLGRELSPPPDPASAGAAVRELMETKPNDKASGLAERARTVRDVLGALAGSERIEDGEAADRVSELMVRREVGETLDRVENLPEQIGEKPANPETLVALDDSADRLEVTARELDRLYRSLVAPRIEQLRRIEEEAVTLNNQMNSIETSEGVGQWQQGLEDLLEEMEQAEGGGDTREELAQMAERGVLPSPADWDSGRTGFFGPPEVYRTRMPLLVEEVQRQIQELVLMDLASDRDEPTPPAYEHLVERYLKVLAADGK
ncbi:MAG: hypothetical protein KY476_11630, partial [Planctomycetes bacterium]|nr:hypothetical protein [Planctomycetota bacterium]